MVLQPIIREYTQLHAGRVIISGMDSFARAYLLIYSLRKTAVSLSPRTPEEACTTPCRKERTTLILGRIKFKLPCVAYGIKILESHCVDMPDGLQGTNLKLNEGTPCSDLETTTIHSIGLN